MCTLLDVKEHTTGTYQRFQQKCTKICCKQYTICDTVLNRYFKSRLILISKARHKILKRFFTLKKRSLRKSRF